MASAAVSLTIQATIPDVLPDEAEIAEGLGDLHVLLTKEALAHGQGFPEGGVDGVELLLGRLLLGGRDHVVVQGQVEPLIPNLAFGGPVGELAPVNVPPGSYTLEVQPAGGGAAWLPQPKHRPHARHPAGWHCG